MSLFAVSADRLFSKDCRLFRGSKYLKNGSWQGLWRSSSKELSQGSKGGKHPLWYLPTQSCVFFSSHRKVFFLPPFFFPPGSFSPDVLSGGSWLVFPIFSFLPLRRRASSVKGGVQIKSNWIVAIYHYCWVPWVVSAWFRNHMFKCLFREKNAEKDDATVHSYFTVCGFWATGGDTVNKSNLNIISMYILGNVIHFICFLSTWNTLKSW